MAGSLSRVLTVVGLTTCLAVSQKVPQDSVPTFNSETKLVLIPFNVIQGIYFAPDLKPEDISLLEDGRPREFTIFEGPETGRRPPIELILLFDTTTLPPLRKNIRIHWDKTATYAFTHDWGDRESLAVLEKNGADVRASVYRYDYDRLQRLCGSTKDPKTLSTAIHQLTEPMPSEGAIQLELPKGGRSYDARSNSKAPLIVPLGWTLEALIETLRDSTATPSNAMRTLIVFSEAAGPTSTRVEDAVSASTKLGIPVYPVVLDFAAYVREPAIVVGVVSGSFRVEGAIPLPSASGSAAVDVLNGSTIPMARFGNLGQMTGGGALYPSKLDAETVDRVLEIVRDRSLSQYVVGFAPSPTGRQHTHSLEIKLKSRSTAKMLGGKRTAVY